MSDPSKSPHTHDKCEEYGCYEDYKRPRSPEYLYDDYFFEHFHDGDVPSNIVSKHHTFD